MVASAAGAGGPMYDVVVLERSGRGRAARGAPHPVGPPAAAVSGGHQLHAAVRAARAQADRRGTVVHLRAHAGSCQHMPGAHAFLRSILCLQRPPDALTGRHFVSRLPLISVSRTATANKRYCEQGSAGCDEGGVPRWWL